MRLATRLILVVYLLLATTLTFLVPLAEAPDELDHFRFIHYLATHHRLPVMSPIFAENETMEANQPPLYYALQALLVGWLPLPDQSAELTLNPCFQHDTHYRPTFYLHTPAEWSTQPTWLAFRLARLISVIMGAGTLLLAMWIGREIAPQHPQLSIFVGLLLAFHPQFLFITASVNNDVLMTLLGTAILALSLWLWQHPLNLRLTLLTAVLITASLLTKFALFALFPLLALAISRSFWRTSHRPLSLLLVIALLPLLLAGWWFGRNVALYGDPLVWAVHLQAKGAFVARTAPLTSADLREFLIIHTQSWWAWFGWLNLRPANTLYLFYVPFALIGFILAWRPRPLIVPRWLILLSLLGTYAALFRYIQTINWSGYQGRLSFASLAAIHLFFALGWLPWAKWIAPPYVAVSLFALFGTVWPAYTHPQLYLSPPPSADLQPICLAQGEWQLESITAPTELLPQTTYQFPITWFGSADQSFTAELRDPLGHIIGSAQLTEINPQGEGILTVVVDDTPRTRATLWSAETPLFSRRVAVAAPLVTPQYPLNATFGQSLQLLGYDSADTQDGTLDLTLYWQLIAPISADYTHFLHLLAPDATLISQKDAQPHGGLYPTGAWSVGEIVTERLTLPRPTTPFTLAVGWYHPQTMQNLLLPDGQSRFTWSLSEDEQK